MATLSLDLVHDVRPEVTPSPTVAATAAPRTPRTVLLVEDSPSDARLMREGLERSTSAVLHVVSSYDAAVRFLRREGTYVTAPVPDLILLDLGLQGPSGFRLLEELRQDAATATVPVIVLSCSPQPADVDRAYALGANCYVRKPLDPAEYFETVRLIDQLWLRVARLPSRDAVVR